MADDTGAAPRRCPLCGGVGAAALTTWDRNREVTATRFRYDRCRTCGTLYLVDVPVDLARYYAGDYYRFDSLGEPEWKRDPRLRQAASEQVTLLRRHVESGRLIEIGSGAGAFAAAAQATGFDVTAIEMDARCCDFLRAGIGIEAIQSDQPVEVLDTLPPAQAIVLWQVLEHLREPGALLDLAAAKLVPGGVLALGVPNLSSLQFRLLRARWAHVDAPRHLSLFPTDALVGRAHELGLERVELTTDDCFARICNEFGWVYALARRPGRRTPGLAPVLAARALTRAVAPLERSGARGTMLTLLLQRSA